MAKSELGQNIKGGADIAPVDMILRNRIIDTLRKKFEQYGYLPLETASLNYLSLLTYKYEKDAEILAEIYKLRDQGDRDLGLRYDLTVPFCKYIAGNQNVKMPFKRYEIGKVWRNGPVKSGRAREFYQCDADAVGIEGAHIEAEMVALAIEAFLELGIDPIIKYNSRKLLPQNDAIFSIIDRIDKVTQDETLRDLCHHMPHAEAEKMLDDLKNGRVTKNIEIIEFEKAVVELGIDKYCVFTPSLVRGQNYYTGMVFEGYHKQQGVTCSICGGGRYDNIIGNFIDNGQKYPAVGIGFGFEPIITLLKNTGAGEKISAVDLMLIPLGTESWCQNYATKLRKKGQKILVYLGGKTIGKAIEYAASYAIKRVAVIGQDEVGGKEITIKEIN